jgi:hypothetical protein
VDVFGSSGGAVNALALVAEHPRDVATLVAHEPPLLMLLPDADHALGAERAVQEAYHHKGFGTGMASFIAMTSWQGEFSDEYAAQPDPDPAQFGLPTEDDGARDDPVLSGTGNAITRYRPAVQALAAAATRVVIAAGVESRTVMTGRAAAATAQALNQPLTEFPSHHAGFLGGELAMRVSQRPSRHDCVRFSTATPEATNRKLTQSTGCTTPTGRSGQLAIAASPTCWNLVAAVLLCLDVLLTHAGLGERRLDCFRHGGRAGDEKRVLV